MKARIEAVTGLVFSVDSAWLSFGKKRIWYTIIIIALEKCFKRW